MKVTGVDKLLKQFDQFGKAGQRQAAEEVQSAALDIHLTAIQIVPVNFAGLKDSIQPKKVNDLTWEVVATADYAGYVEFGTGSKVYVPKEMQDMANAIRGKKGGSIDEALKSMKDWCHAKGIDERAAWPILMSILDEGLRPRPYLYPSWVQGSAKFVKKLNASFNELTKQFNASK